MSELRQDPTTYDWVIIAKERARRPHDFKRDVSERPLLPSRSDDCPFCPGNEERTPAAAAVYGDPDNWNIRVVPNKFPALTPEGDTTREEWKLFRKSRGYGKHEVVIETPVHNKCIPFMEDDHVAELLKVYRDRYHALKKDPNVKIILIFKNHGLTAGTSLEHPHTQIVASPVVPPFIRRRFEIATQHFDNTGRCLYCDILHDEHQSKDRIVKETPYFTALHPFASHYPFETWIMPKLHSSSFGNILEVEIGELAGFLKEILLKLYVSLGDPDYNFIIHTSPVDDEHKTYYLWHIQIVPKLTFAAGFELGSGININTAVPEETAAFMRGIKV
ncbi:MAG: galactose-1-phosphate uridylyltransferase [Nitrospiraceae bacterium]|nr:MAG: galactose-1-phosphate uridylyltransferase [Nitrospiraceae bacterium]